MDDSLLINRYVQHRDENAFAALMQKYVNLVYSASLRQTGDSHAAEDVTQAVFLTLAQKAAQLKPDIVLSAWLLTVTNLTSANARRREANRNRIEKEAAAMSELNEKNGAGANVPDWSSFAPFLDSAIAELEDTDRAAVVLRYFEKCTARDIGERLGITQDAAEKRVSRSIEKLRKSFARHGIAVSAIVLTSLLTENSVHAAPPALAASVAHALASASTAAAVPSGAIIATTTKGAVKIMALSASKQLVIGAVVCAAVSTGGFMLIRSSTSAAVPGNSGPVAAVPNAPAPTPASTTAATEPPTQSAATPSPAPAKLVEPTANEGAIKGVIRYKGTPPVNGPIALPVKDQDLCRCTSVPDESLQVDAGTRAIRDVVIRVLDVNAPQDKTEYPVPEITQKGCKFSPHVTVVKPGSSVMLMNPDAIIHNFHTTPLDLVNPAMNIAINETKRVITAKYFAEPEIIQMQCDMHPWMKGLIVVHDPRFVRVTGADGSFEIRGLPPGKHKVSIFHGSLGEQTLDIDVKPGQTIDLGDTHFGK